MSFWLNIFGHKVRETFTKWRTETWHFCLGVTEGWDPEVRKVIIEFFTEAAVLIAVFPILDTIIGGRAAQPSQFGIKNVTWGLVSASEGLAAFLLALACIMSLGKRN